MFKILVAPTVNRGVLICKDYALTERGATFTDLNDKPGFVPYTSFGAILPLTEDEAKELLVLEEKLKAEMQQLREAANQTDIAAPGKTMALPVNGNGKES